MIKLIIFDYDGVIVDSFSNVHRVYKIICKKLNKNCPNDFDSFKEVYGEHHLHFYDKLNFTDDEREKADIIFKKEIIKQKTNVFNEIDKLLKDFHKKYKLFILTSNYKEEVINKLTKHNILRYFDKIIGKETYSIKRFEKVEIIKKILKDYDLNQDEVVLIGDRNVDFKEGVDAGLKHILLVDYGWGYDKLKIPEWEQKFVVKKPIDLIKAIDKIKD